MTAPVLAIHGGPSIRRGSWPEWPQATDRTVEHLLEAVKSGRWSTTGLSRGTPTFTDQFACAFAEYVGVAHCLPVSSGTSALKVALEALGIGAGDEVIVPGLTWIADVEAVLTVNAVPVLADIEADTLCLDPTDTEACIGPRTAAILPVHLAGAVAMLDPLRKLATRHGLALIEDASQAHGSRFHNLSVGAYGEVGTFSMHNSKLLTSGEGGALVTPSSTVASRAHQLATNGRLPAVRPVPLGQMDMLHAGEISGSNHCLSEFQAAVLLGQLEELDTWNERRARSAALLTEGLCAMGMTTQKTAQGTTRRSYSNFVFLLPEELVNSIGRDLFARAMGEEVSVVLKPLDVPLNRSPLLKPETRPSWRWYEADPASFKRARRQLPIAEEGFARGLALPHPYLLGNEADMADFLAGVEKVLANLDQLMAAGRQLT